jgi:hypothetical protein
VEQRWVLIIILIGIILRFVYNSSFSYVAGTSEKMDRSDMLLTQLKEKMVRAGFTEHREWLDSFRIHDNNFDKVFETERSMLPFQADTILIRSRGTDRILLLTCCKRRKRRLALSNGGELCVECRYRTRLTKFKDTDSIFAETLVRHTDHEPGSDHH